MALIGVSQYAQGGELCGQEARGAGMLAATQFLPAAVREMDSVGQYGPGCFALLLPTAELPNAVQVAERLRRGFSEYSRLSQLEHQMLTLNVGVAEITERDDSVSLLKRAEAALDAANRQGSNLVYYHDGGGCAPITAMLETMDCIAGGQQ